VLRGCASDPILTVLSDDQEVPVFVVPRKDHPPVLALAEVRDVVLAKAFFHGYSGRDGSSSTAFTKAWRRGNRRGPAERICSRLTEMLAAMRRNLGDGLRLPNGEALPNVDSQRMRARLQLQARTHAAVAGTHVCFEVDGVRVVRKAVAEPAKVTIRFVVLPPR
jgi:hypothetical protein